MKFFNLKPRKSLNTSSVKEAASKDPQILGPETSASATSSQPSPSAEKETTKGRMVMNLIILDKSGSMEGIRNAAIAGVNETIGTIRRAATETGLEQRVTLIAFCECGMSKIYDYASINDIKPLTRRDYEPCCSTPLYDAIGHNCLALKHRLERRPQVAVNVTIITDGYENASRKWSAPQVKALIEELKEKGWMFAFIGANIDVEAVSFSLSIDNSLRFDANEESVKEMFEREGKARLGWNKCLLYEDEDDCYNPEALHARTVGYFNDNDERKPKK